MCEPGHGVAQRVVCLAGGAITTVQMSDGNTRQRRGTRTGERLDAIAQHDRHVALQSLQGTGDAGDPPGDGLRVG